MANTVILKWDPAVSSYSMSRFLNDIIRGGNVSEWGIRDHEQVKFGDTFYMVKVGNGQTGIVMEGKITSDPDEGGDRSGWGRKICFCDCRAEIMINPDTFGLLSTAKLQDNIPVFEWDGGDSGVILPPKFAAMLEKMWNSYLQENAKEFSSRLEFLKNRKFQNDQLFLSPQLSGKLFS